MDPHIDRPRPAFWLGTAALALLVGIGAYYLGLAHGSALDVADTGRRWHVGFPFGALFLLFWLFVIGRGLFWGWGCGGWRYRRYASWYDDPSRWDEWHRRAHDQMNRPPAT
jgi:hypothetical protein